MNHSTIEAYAEIDEILNLMDEEYASKIPYKLRKIFKEHKSENYKKKILLDKPLKEQNLKKETLSILAVLNYNYWCNDTKKKKELIQLYANNEKIKQEELREKYNPDNLFENQTVDITEIKKEPITNEITIINDKESIFRRIRKWFKSLFSK